MSRKSGPKSSFTQRGSCAEKYIFRPISAVYPCDSLFDSPTFAVFPEEGESFHAMRQRHSEKHKDGAVPDIRDIPTCNTYNRGNNRISPIVLRSAELRGFSIPLFPLPSPRCRFPGGPLCREDGAGFWSADPALLLR